MQKVEFVFFFLIIDGKMHLTKRKNAVVQQDIIIV